MPVHIRGEDDDGDDGDEAGTTTVYGCRLCATHPPTTAETEAWSHVLRVHDKASMPDNDESIFAFRFPTPVDE